MKKIIKLISIVAMTLFSAFSLQGQGFMTLSCENRDEDVKASLAIKMTSPSGKQTTFKEEDLTAKVLGYELAEKGIYNIETYFFIPKEGKNVKYMAKSDFFISGDETSVDAALSFGSCNVVWCKDSSDAKSCHLRIVKKYPAELQGRFDEDDAKTTKSVETFPASKWDVQVESVY